MLPASALRRFARALPLVICLVTLAVYVTLIDLKGISTDEGIRLGIMNGGHAAQPNPGPPWATWDDVLATVKPYAYQPAYYLMQNSAMRLTARQDILLFRQLNIGFLALCLLALLVLSRDWPTWPRCFLVGLFAFNAYLIMHVLQVREYIVAVAVYLWSTWLVFRLDRRQLDREWSDLGWFAAYGLLLSFGFFLQTWTVFPAIAQGAFLVLRRRPQFWRFNAHLALSYLIVFSLAWPYLYYHQQKVNVGLWERAEVTLLGQLRQGFQLVLSGHLPGHAWFTSVLPWAWLALVAAGIGVCWRRPRAFRPGFVSDCGRQAWLMLLCILVPLAFQIAYFFKVEPLSVWPRYFIVHYFFLTWLIALAFRALHEARSWPRLRRPLSVGLIAVSGVLTASAVYQVRSFHAAPYLDTALSRSSDWRVGTQLLARYLRPGDVIVTQDFITRATLSFTHPVAHPVLRFEDVSSADLSPAPRVLFLQQGGWAQANLSDLASQLADRGFGPPTELAVSAPVPPETEGFWHLVAFIRPS